MSEQAAENAPEEVSLDLEAGGLAAFATLMDALVAEEREVMYDLTASVNRPPLDSVWGYSLSDSDV